MPNTFSIHLLIIVSINAKLFPSVPQQPADREWIPLDNDPSNSNSPGMSWIPGQWRYGRGKEWRGSANGYYHSVLNMVFDGLICFSMRNRCLHSPFLQCPLRKVRHLSTLWIHAFMGACVELS